MTHACNVIEILESHFLSYEDFIRFFGADLIVERSGNGDRWYQLSQVNQFIHQQLK